MVLKFRAWRKMREEMGKVKRIRFDDDGNVTTVLFEGKLLGVNTKIDEIELMQSTGLHDKNGKEIFEGDIIRYDIDVVDIKKHPTLGFYTVLDGREGFFGDGMSINDFEEDAKEFSKTVEIIGNIYENPELLEDK